MTEAVIKTEKLTKVYGERSRKPFTALHDLDLTVQPGEIFGYLGPNGAGKTTTIRTLLDFIRPTSGRAYILGRDANADSLTVHRHIGYLPGELALWRNEKALDVIRYMGRLHGGVDMRYVRELAERLQFDMTKKVRDYSSGNKRKLGLILAMMHRPQLLIMDEPTSGLDPLVQQTFNTLMREFRDRGGTVFLSSHVLSEVQAICDRVAVLRGGELKAVERVETLVEAQFQWVTLNYREPVKIESQLEKVPGVSEMQVNNGGKQVKLRISGDFDPLLRTATQQYVVSMDVDRPTLEEIFLAYYDDSETTTPRDNGRNGKVQQDKVQEVVS